MTIMIIKIIIIIIIIIIITTTTATTTTNIPMNQIPINVCYLKCFFCTDSSDEQSAFNGL